MKIRAKYFLSFIVTSLILTVLATIIFYFVTKSFFELQAQKQVKSLAQAKADSVDVFVRSQKNLVNTTAFSIDLNDLLTESADGVLNQVKLAQVQPRLNDAMNKGSYVYGIYILNKNGSVVLSSLKEMVGKNYDEDLQHLKLTRDIHLEMVKYCQTSDRPCLTMALPVFSKINGEFMGALVFDFGLDILNSSMVGMAGMGKTGDSYLVDQDGLYLTESRFNSKSTLKEKASQSQMAICSQNERFGLDLDRIDIKRHFNSKAQEVLSTCIKIPNSQWFLVVEIGVIEAYESLDKIYLVGLLSVVLIVIFGYFFASAFSKQIIDPILALQSAIENIKQGDFTQSISLDRKDELGALANGFNDMIKAVANSRLEMVKHVKKQTQEIDAQKQDLYDQQRAVLNILEDIEEEKSKADTEREKLATVVQGIGDAVIVVDAEGMVMLFNHGAEIITGITATQAINNNYHDIVKLVDDSNNEPIPDFIASAMSESKVVYAGDKSVIVKANGAKLAVSGNAAPLWNHEGLIMGSVAVLRDVSREREVDKMKTEFISITSHQMRTPLSTMNWYLEALLTGQAGELNEDQKEFVSQLNIGNTRLIKIVNSILNISRIEAGRLKIDPEPTDIVEWLKSEIKEVEPLAKQSEIAIQVSLPEVKLPLVPIDQGLWEQVIHNFLTNAVKYSLNTDRKEVSVKLVQEGKDFIISVTDSGIGIPKDAQSKIFQKFYRAKNAMHSDADGTGLGLYVAKMIADLAGGRLWFESEEGKGTTFYASLPLSGMKKHEGDRKLEVGS